MVDLYDGSLGEVLPLLLHLTLGLTEDHAPDVIEVKVLVERLLSYVEFWRIGHRLEEDDWRRDFVAEVRSILTRLEAHVERLHRLALARA